MTSPTAKRLVRTRIAPSPTGDFHIGTARTALVNWLFAKQNKGEFLLRIEDSDRERSQEKYTQDILEGLNWLGLNHDDAPVKQSQRGSAYQKAVEHLLVNGDAYKEKGAIYFKVTGENDIEFNDLIRGKVKFRKRDIQDFAIARADGSALFYLTGVVDDHAMRITHVIRGEEHLSNTPKQILLQQALGYPAPVYAHLPLILNPDRSKMSKRHNPVSITRDFKNQGYLPQAMISFLALLGWHPANAQLDPTKNPSQAQEIFSLEQLMQIYDIHRVQKGGAIFQIEKLQSINQYYISQLNSQKLLEQILPFAKFAKSDLDKIARAAWVVKSHLKTLGDFSQLASFFWNLPKYPAKRLIFRKSTKQKTLRALKKVLGVWEKLHNRPNPDQIKRQLQNLVGDYFGAGDIFWSARVALSGLENSPPPEQIAWVLGKGESQKRLQIAIDKLTSDAHSN